MARKPSEEWTNVKSDSTEAVESDNEPETPQDSPDERSEAPEGKPSFWPETKQRRRGREFPLRDILQAITGVMLSRSWEEQLELVGYMIGQRRTNTKEFKNVTYQIAQPYCKTELLVQFPELEQYQELKFDMESSAEASAAWLEEVEKKHGSVLKVEILPDKFADEVDEEIRRVEKEMNPPRKKVTYKGDEALTRI